MRLLEVYADTLHAKLVDEVAEVLWYYLAMVGLLRSCAARLENARGGYRELEWDG